MRVERGFLLGRQLRRRRLAAERLSLGRLRPLDPPLRRLRRDERERAAVRRAVVVGEPERQVDERRRQPGEDRLDGLRVDPLGCLVGDLDDDAAHAPAAEADAHHGALLDVVLDRVGERAGRARGR